MTTRLPPQCLMCKHWVTPLDRDDPDARGPDPIQICDAFRFPNGIPADVWRNKVDHRQPVEGDHGIQFEALPGMEFPEWAMADQP